jgi:hypothetical protein
MKNFIRQNIHNIKGARKAASIEREKPKSVVTKHYSGVKNISIHNRVS